MQLKELLGKIKRWTGRPLGAPSPALSEAYIYRPNAAISFSEGVASLRSQGHTVVETAIHNTEPGVIQAVQAAGEALGLSFHTYTIDPEAYRAYFDQAGYTTQYPNYYLGNQPEKSLEHFVALELLQVGSDDVFVDLASENSPIPEIYARLTGAKTYSQDIMYPPGIQGNQIGGDACQMPVPDGFMTKAALTCSLEHFEGDGDTRLFQEMARVLQPGGKICVVPFYVFDQAAIQTDPTVSVPAKVKFDPGVPLYCAQGWGNRQGRFYSPQSFVDRIFQATHHLFQFDFYYLENAALIDPSIYARFAFVATRL